MKKYVGMLMLISSIIVLMILSACGKKESSAGIGKLPADAPQTLDEAIDYYATKRIGVLAASSMEQSILEKFPDAEHYYFATGAEMKNALLSNKIDAFVFDDSAMRIMTKEDPRVVCYEEALSEQVMAFVFNKETGTELCDEFNRFLVSMREKGEIDRLIVKWFSSTEDTRVEIDYKTLPDVNGTLEIVTEASFSPFEYYVNNEISGYEIELLAMFAKEYGYAVNLSDVRFTTIVTSVKLNKADIGVAGLSITEERKQSVLFSDPVYTGKGLLCVKSDYVSSQSPVSKIVESFEKTFIKENRWQMILMGILHTLLITGASAGVGTLCGFIVFSLSRKGNRIVLKIVNRMSWLIHGMPVVVFLLIMYYIVFGRSSLNGLTVSIVAFSVLFTFDVADILLQGNRVIDCGQIEAAYMLGYDDRKAFIRILLPQIIVYVIPSYSAAIVSLLKSTAIVGYIAVEDITKVSDIISARTYESFFPLLVSAILYFLIAWIPKRILEMFFKHIDPKQKMLAEKKAVKEDVA